MKEESNEILVFVYGTLLSGEVSHRLIEHARFLGPATTVASFELIDLGDYPALVLGGDAAIRGELYEVDRATLREIDRFEGHPDFYRRLEILLADGGTAQSYLLDRERAAPYPRIRSGDWRRARSG